ncbi:hypothetical protein CAEBREN_06620 [Caenorhabditis brenneri]|uniref:EGF-like domain-containing protein n=1 Tax=Caenorhabditis brenneri TaxID=135651 RepID=G0P5C0_CAEBE|nr:hypothetical protein CAEBREN_06620 [Caenorhabditis brenneri]
MRTSWLLILLGLIKVRFSFFSKKKTSTDHHFQSTSQSTNTTCDLSKEFDCGTGSLGCLPKAWQCDNVKDCHNGADEIDCEPNECKEGYFLCRNGKCMESTYKCDGIPDCPDKSDEKHCKYNYRRLNVPAPFHYGDPSLYTYDDGFDENGCLPGFGYCPSQQSCIPNQLFCDGQADCAGDMEDERNCTRDEPIVILPSSYVGAIPSIMRIYENPCKDKFVCKTNETYKDEVCIQMNELCNAKKECPMGDDESEKCSECSTKRCGHHCKNTPTGAKCECRKGYRLNPDGITCVDIDECTLPKRACHHFCENHIGSFRCSCAKGYNLKDDEKSCLLTNPSKGSLLLGFYNKIEERPLEDFSGTNFTSIFHKFNRTISAFDYFHRDHKLFMVTCDGSLLCRNGKLVVRTEGKPSKIIRENVSHSTNLAVDWIGGNIFFTEIVPEFFPITRISVCTMDGKFCRVIVETKMPRSYTAFAIHPMRGLVFYTEYKKDSVRIMMAAMDGSQEQVLVEGNPSTIIMPLTIDYLNNNLYFGDHVHSNIQRINIDTKKTTVITPKFQHAMIDSMVFYNGFLYSTEHYTHVQVLDVTRKNARAHMVAPIDSLGSALTPRMAINDSRHQLEPSYNPCQELDCPWICVIVPGFTAKCLCPDGYTPSLLGTTCIPNPLETEEPNNLTLSFESHIGLEAMREYCKTGQGCLNGGSCREVSNKTRIVCDCLEPYDGLYCERRKPILSDEAILIIIILILLSIAIGCGVYWFFYYRRNKKDGAFDTESIVSKSTFAGAVYYENDAVSLG